MILCATGHRPNKLGGYSDEAKEQLVVIARNALMQLQPTKVVSGMALGWDQAIAEAARRLAFPMVAAVPFKGQEKAWPQSSQDEYNTLLDYAMDIVYVCDEGYAPWKMQKRNEWMVDTSHGVIAMWDGSTGGTYNCIQYAMKKHSPINNFWNEYETTTERIRRSA